MKASALRTNTAASHTAYDGTRTAAGIEGDERRDKTTAAVTITSTPDSASRSARIQMPNVPMNCMTIELGTCEKRRTMLPNTNAYNTPTTTLPISTNASDDTTPIELPAFAIAAPTASR